MLTSKHIFYGGKHTPGDTSATLSGQIVPDPVWHKFLKGIALPQGCDVCDARTCLTSPNMLVGKIVTVHMFNSYTCGFTGPHSYKGRVTPWLTAYEDSGAIGLYYYSIYGTVLMSSVSYVDMTLTDPITIPWWSGSSTMGGDNLDSFMMTHLEAIFDGNVTLTIVLQEEEFGKIPIDFVRSTGAIVWYRIVALWNNFLTFLAIYVLYKMGRPITIPHAVVFMEGVVACSLRSWRRWWDPTYVGAPWVFLISHLSRTLYNAPSQISTLLMCYVWLRMVLTRKFSAAAENVILLLLIMVMAGCLGGLFYLHYLESWVFKYATNAADYELQAKSSEIVNTTYFGITIASASIFAFTSIAFFIKFFVATKNSGNVNSRAALVRMVKFVLVQMVALFGACAQTLLLASNEVNERFDDAYPQYTYQFVFVPICESMLSGAQVIAFLKPRSSSSSSSS